MYARCEVGFRGALTVSLQSADGRVYARRTLRGVGSQWKRFAAVLTASGTDPKARLVHLPAPLTDGHGAEGPVSIDANGGAPPCAPTASIFALRFGEALRPIELLQLLQMHPA